ncbi:MAG TPA: NYN domain-containing protein [Anaerolineales bacterium]|nr:NYN domain-containing protein [Anaerolineales bacterium]HNK62548.1 NYN domain-containing protein [Anaerolineales bacterium]HNN12796.1 NYN domain-containing protein [Anaerolineales bacterium]
MPYLIDGHNLIPKLGLRLDEPDDEMELVHLLQEFARLKRQQVEVYFDGAPAGQAGTRKLGTIKAHFIPLGQTADSAMRKRLNSMGKTAKEWMVVSSDREVQRAARVNQAGVVSSEEFVGQIRSALTASTREGGVEKKISAQEVEDWLRLFSEGKD